MTEDGKVYERLPGNKFWWTIGSLKAIKTEDITGVDTILYHKEPEMDDGES